MSETYPPGGYASDGAERAGGVIIVTASVLAAVLVIAGLFYAMGTSARHNAAVLAAGCEPALFISGLPCTTQQMVISQYGAVVNPAVRQLTADTAAYQANEKHHLVAAEAALTAEVATIQALDNSLAAMAYTPANRARALALITSASSTGNQVPPPAAITFTPQMTVASNTLLQDNQALAKLLARQARSTTLTQLQSSDPRVAAATAAVMAQMNLVRKIAQLRPGG
jgi:hypothetical protein